MTADELTPTIKQARGGIEIMPIAFMDDTNILLPRDNVWWFLKMVQSLGVPVGVIIAGNTKTKILTNMTGVSILPFLPAPAQATSLKKAIDRFTEGTCTTAGLQILGSLLGSFEFQSAYTDTFKKTLVKDTETLPLPTGCEILGDQPSPRQRTQWNSRSHHWAHQWNYGIGQ
mmetsp:Transcript_3766/g.6824  ORF Transcript_3766/g.6824 Transcript_3766/m.6824 type:complete len:172 (-) Transcript_3766:515-1030(-)|eukprot:CAMPEP_0198306466 /NCGR_PEP_ID=MMETSP1449-20131203/58431_1 /TAXON_ID=420275 /ORGANISM="Attheya septentrionalis, Strain CCMP2084" /LENGTH=171 /DNA_ID=CAMNT_0044009021 /DNA_START=831 /DNA_END=1346 /DNA_ORIENTATION=-